MELIIKTATAYEPVSLVEFKMHLRAESSTFAVAMTPYQSIAPGAHVTAASYSLKGSGVDVLGKRTLVRLNSGTNGSSATVDAKIQESDTDSDALYTDWTGGGFTQVTEANDNANQEIEYTGIKRYIRVVSTVATDTCSFAVIMEVETAAVSEDDLLNDLIVASREYAEHFTGRALINRTWTGYLDTFPRGNWIVMPQPPLSSVTSVKYREYNYTGTDPYDWTEFSSDYYITDNTRYKGRIVLAYGKSWPSFTAYPASPIAIEFVAGYGATSASVPESIRRAILLYAATLYEFREGLIAGMAVSKIARPYAVDNLLWQTRVEV